MGRQLVFEVTDPQGRRVSLDDDAAIHIISQHPEMEAYVAEMRGVIERPDLIQPDPWPGRERYFRAAAGPSEWLFAVVDFEVQPARVVTAYGKRKGPTDA